MDKNNLVLLHLSLIKEIGPRFVLKFLKKLFDEFIEKYKNPVLKKIDFDLSLVYFFTMSDFINKFGFTKRQACLLVNGLLDKEILEKELSLIKKYDIDLISFFDDDYPNLLKEIYAPPIVLYCKGEKLINYEKSIAVVGSRRNTTYAKRVITEIVPELVENGFSIVSGGAIGVDTIAHKQALEKNSKTIVVLGSGLLKPYPGINIDFFRKIALNSGTLVSPFPLLRESDRGTFPARNRIIAGLSMGCLVVQAAKKSGALITAKFALEEGRQVFAVPGDLFDSVSQGCHNLIKQGAKLVASSKDILEEFGIDVNKKVVKKSENNVQEVNSADELIFQKLKKEISIDKLTLELNMELPALQEKLFDLELQGKVKQNISGYWELA